MPVSPSLYIWEVVISVHGMAHAGSHTHTEEVPGRAQNGGTQGLH